MTGSEVAGSAAAGSAVVGVDAVDDPDAAEGSGITGTSGVADGSAPVVDADSSAGTPPVVALDMGNWLWVGDSPEEAARHLAPAVSYIHVKAAEPHHAHFRAVPPDEAPARWLALLDNLPADAPRGIEFPLVGHDLTAVTRRYVNLLREE